MNQQDIIAARLDFLNGHAKEDLTEQMLKHVSQDKNLADELEFITKCWQDQNLTEQPSSNLDRQFYQMLELQTSKPNWLERLKQTLSDYFAPKHLLQVALMAGMFGLGYQFNNNQFNGSQLNSNTSVAALQQQVNSLNAMVAMNMINSQSASKRLAGIKHGAAIAIDDPTMHQALLQLLRHDQASSIRLSALDALSQQPLSAKLEQQLVNSFKDQTLLVQIQLLNVLFSYGSPDALSQLSTGNKHFSLLPEAQDYLHQLSNQPI